MQVEFVSANPTGPLHIGPRAQRRARRRARAAVGGRRVDGRARVLLQRRRHARWSGSAPRSRRATCRRWGATPRCPRTATSATTSPTSRSDIVGEHGDAFADLPERRARGAAPRRGLAGACWTRIAGTLERFGVPVRRLLLRGRAGAQGRDRRGDRAAARRGRRLRGRRAPRGSAARPSATTRTAS